MASFRRQPTGPTNEAVLKAITTLAGTRTRQAHRKFYTTLLNSSLLMAEDPIQGRPVLLDDGAGGAILPVFTDVERLQQVFPTVRRYGTMPARDIFALALENKIYVVNINPEIGPGCFLHRDELNALAKGKLPRITADAEPVLDNPKLVQLGDPAAPTQELLDRLMDAAYELLLRESIVQAAYLIMTRSTESERPRLTVALHFDEAASIDAKSALSQRFVPAVERVISQPLGLLWLEGEQYHAISATVTPFYTRTDS